jgi:hypothetical protein
MKNPVVSLPSDRRAERVRVLHGAVARFQVWQRSVQSTTVIAPRRRPHHSASVRPRGR